jgi:hypothetical protein
MEAHASLFKVVPKQDRFPNWDKQSIEPNELRSHHSDALI